MIVCIDTNVVLGMFGRTAPWLPLRHGLLANPSFAPPKAIARNY